MKDLVLIGSEEKGNDLVAIQNTVTTSHRRSTSGSSASLPSSALSSLPTTAQPDSILLSTTSPDLHSNTNSNTSTTTSSTSTTTSNTTMGIIQRKKQSSQSRIWIVMGLAAAVAFSVWLDARDTNMVGTPMETHLDQSRKGKPPLKATMDVNAPPNEKLSTWEKNNDVQVFKRSSLKISSKQSVQKSSFSFWGQQSNRLEKEKPSKTIQKEVKSEEVKAEIRSPIPIINDQDDKVPLSPSGNILRAADALYCRSSVVDYVINATDTKDECDGLRKAYTKHCGDDEGSPAMTSRRRRLQHEASPSPSNTFTNTVDSIARNPIIRWQHRLYRLVRAIQHWCKPKPDILMIEDEVLKEWDSAAYVVEQGWDLIQTDDDGIYTDMDYANYRRQTSEAADFSRLEKILDDKEAAATKAENVQTDEPLRINRTDTINPGGHKEKSIQKNLNLPFKGPVSAKMISEAHLLQDDKLMAQAMAASNFTASVTATPAAADAAASSKAVASAVDFVSSVLNDPTSVEARTCCTSILNVFHDNCNFDDEEEFSDKRLFIVVAVIAVCGMVKSLIRHFQIRWLPEAAGCILVGVASGWVLTFYPHHDFSFDGPWFLRIMVPPIVFEAALSIDKRSFNRHVVPIIIYAVVGTLVATGLTAVFLHEGSKYFRRFCDPIPIVEALTFGALISSIDPIAVLSVLSNMGMTDTDTIYVIIFGESLLNDGVAIVLFQTLVHFLDVKMQIDSHAVTAAAIHFVVVAIGSLLVGLASGICCTVYYWLMHGCQTPLVEVLMFCCWALLPYYVCDGIEWSGIVAVVATGFVMDIYVVGQHGADDGVESHLDLQSPSPKGTKSQRERRRRAIFSTEGHLSKEAKTHIGFVTEIMATMMETSIFAYLGLFLFSSRYHWNNFHTTLAITACCISRAIMIPCLSTLANWVIKMQQVRANCRSQQLPQQQEYFASQAKEKYAAGVVIDRKMQLILWFAGLRGAMSFALVENIPLYDAVTGEGTRLKSELKAMTSACIIFTVFVLGGSTYYIMENLGMTPNSKGAENSKLTREMEMIGLLAKKKEGSGYNNDDESEDDYGYASESDVPNGFAPAGTNSGNTFRQRPQTN